MSSSDATAPLSHLKVAILGASPVSVASAALYGLFGAECTLLVEESASVVTNDVVEPDLIRLLAGTSERIQLEDRFSPSAIERASEFDIVICDVSHDLRVSTEGFVAAYCEAVESHNKSVWVTVSAFGVESQRRSFRATELTALASGGIPYYMRDGEGRPLKPAGHTASIAAGHMAALAGLFGLTRSDSAPVHLDLSLQDSVVTTGVFLECAHALFKSPGKGGMGRYAAPRGYFQCQDGFVFIVVLEDHQWEGVRKALGHPEWARNIITNADRLENAGLIEDEIRAWAKTMSSAQCASLLQQHGAPASSLNSCQALLDDPDFVEHGFFRSTGNGAEVIPGLPAKLTRSRRNPSLSTEGRRRTRVLDLGNVLAGPLATSWLGTMGLDVLKLEDPTRLDIYRRRGPFIEGGEDIEHGAYFAAANYSKQSCSFEFESEEGKVRLRDLIRDSDFVVENLSSSRARRLGLTPEAADQLGATLISSSGFGRNSKKSEYRAYGQIIHSYGGITYETRDSTGQFRALGTSWADPLTSVWICALVLAQALSQNGERAHVDLSMVKVVARQLPEYFAAASRGEASELDRANSMEGYAPHGIFRAKGDDEWLAVAIRDDAEWRAFIDVVADDRLIQPQFSDQQRRLENREVLDEMLDLVLSDHEPMTLFEQLQPRGVACSPVMSARDLAASDHLRERGLIQEVTHPVWGTREVTGVPWRIVGEGPLRVDPTPTLGSAKGY